MTKKEIIEQFCELQDEVSEFLKWEYAADCFCGKYPQDETYQNEGRSLEFIKQAVFEKIAHEKEAVNGKQYGK